LPTNSRATRPRHPGERMGASRAMRPPSRAQSRANPAVTQDLARGVRTNVPEAPMPAWG
jgi:hypothetical protein